MLSRAAGAEDGVDLVDEDDGGLEFAGEGEYRVDEFVAVAEPFFGQGGDVQVDEAGAGFVGDGFGEHGFAAAWGARWDVRGWEVGWRGGKDSWRGFYPYSRTPEGAERSEDECE